MRIFKKLISALKKALKKSKPYRRKSKSSQKKSRRKISAKKYRSSKGRRITKKFKLITVKPSIEVGEITHYFSKIKVCVVKVKRNTVAIGDQIQIRGASTNVKQQVASLQIENSDVKIARPKALVGMKVKSQVRPGDKVYKL